MDFAEELRGSLQEFLVGATIEIRENGSRITAISPLSGKCEAKAANRCFICGRKTATSRAACWPSRINPTAAWLWQSNGLGA
jgi:hypothetical protein